MRERLVAFLRSPTPESFLLVRESLIAGAAYDPYSRELETVGELLRAAQYAEAQQMLAAAMANLALSPRAHLFAAVAAEHLGDADAEEAEMYIATICVEGILSTGDGTVAAPYRITRVSDEYDVLQYLGKQAAGQSLHHYGGRHLDCVQTADGGELWFDLSDAVARLRQSEPFRALQEKLGRRLDEPPAEPS